MRTPLVRLGRSLPALGTIGAVSASRDSTARGLRALRPSDLPCVLNTASLLCSATLLTSFRTLLTLVALPRFSTYAMLLLWAREELVTKSSTLQRLAAY